MNARRWVRTTVVRPGAFKMYAPVDGEPGFRVGDDVVVMPASTAYEMLWLLETCPHAAPAGVDPRNWNDRLAAILASLTDETRGRDR